MRNRLSRYGSIDCPDAVRSDHGNRRDIVVQRVGHFVGILTANEVAVAGPVTLNPSGRRRNYRHPVRG